MRLWLTLLLAITATSTFADDLARLGIFGSVESVVPLVVAGREIDVPDELPLISLLGTGLAVAKGDTLAVVVAVTNGRLVAQRISEIFAVVGPIRSADVNGAVVMGSFVQVPNEMEVEAGQWIAVSGLWSDVKVITTNLRRVESGGYGQLTGVVDATSKTLGGTVVKAADPPKDGFGSDVWILSGAPEAESLHVRLLSRGVFGSPTDLTVWQGYVSEPVASQTYMIHGTSITGAERDAQMPQAGTLVVRCVRKGRIVSVAPTGLEREFAALDCARHTRLD
ncbi:hypothetical protein [Sulfitobacter guttiformis]|uniref:DUF5666 domain-containing protein n=1 Tax=Sulfitobacter guttiformis TaxID=74349 RepID=A0A420DRF3_9RHOB|nr:hypothetical protein [Sulfitobacter guttiformis]RKE96768.1 hypothetical protein C8N30_1338 [Sulfitobacter guttiformis]